MPHLIIEYSANIATEVDPPRFAKHLSDAAVNSGVFPLSGTRVRFHPVKDYRVADGHPDNAFLHIILRLGYGRDLATRKRAGQTIFDAMRSYFDGFYQTTPMALSLEMVEINPDLSFKQNNLPDHLKSRSVIATE